MRFSDDNRKNNVRTRKNITPKGRSKFSSEQYVRLTYQMINHPNFRALQGSAIKVLLALCAKHHGYNNGKINLSYDDMTEELHISKGTASRACRDLVYYGFLKVKKRGTFYGRQATDWEITFLKSDGYHPTHDWKHQKARVRSRKRKSKNMIEEILSDEFFTQT